MKQKNFIWIALGIVALIVFMNPNVGKQAAGDVTNAVITRSASATTVKAGTAFTLTYTASGMGAGSWGVVVEDDISGGCTPPDIDTGWLSPATTYSATMNAPSSPSTCVFSGTYTFAGSTDKTIQGSSAVVVCEDECLAGQAGCESSNQRWFCDNSGVCGVKVYLNCGVGQTCNNGACTADCTTLRAEALSAITTWSTNPTLANKNTALEKISLWAAGC